jgi:hypothetical protein
MTTGGTEAGVMTTTTAVVTATGAAVHRPVDGVTSWDAASRAPVMTATAAARAKTMGARGTGLPTKAGVVRLRWSQSCSWLCQSQSTFQVLCQ